MAQGWRLALRPTHASVETTAVRLARVALYLRSHWLRLPWHLLIYHLARKAVLRIGRADGGVKTTQPLGPQGNGLG